MAIAWSISLIATGRPGGTRYEQVQAAVVSVFVLAATSGALLLLIGSAPRDGLHLFYAVVALAVVPLARASVGATRDRRSAVLLAVAFVVLGGVTYRLFTTG